VKTLQLTAEPLCDGRIALAWVAPAGSAVIGVRILRRVRRFPDVADLGSEFEIAGGFAPTGTFIDGPLQGETVYYYAVVAFDSAGANLPEFVSTTALTPYETAKHLYRNLPEIYQLFDQADTGTGKGSLSRLLELLGQPLDLVRSATAAMRTFHDVERIDGALLPLLANWIGQPSDSTLNLDRQRNEIRYAPHYHRTAGISANLRASANRFTTWDARIKEFSHNVFLTTHPEQLTIQEMLRDGAAWQPPARVNLAIAYEGRVSPLRTSDGRVWLFYHARRDAPATQGQSQDQWHVYAKLESNGQFLPSFRLTAGPDPCKHPSAVERPDGVVWLFYTRFSYTDSGRLLPHIGLALVTAGKPALAARVIGTVREPFALGDGDTLEVTINGSITRHVTIRPERFEDFATISAASVADLLDRELPGVHVTATAEGGVALATEQMGTSASLRIPDSPLAGKLGIKSDPPVTGADATVAKLIGAHAGPFALADKDTLAVKIDADLPRTIVFSASEFVNIATATALEVAMAIEKQVPAIAGTVGGAVQLHSSGPGKESVVSVLVDASTAAAKLGFGAPPPPAPAGIEEDEPSVCVDATGNLWLFWASRRDGTWKIWYDRSDGTTWDTPKVLTGGSLPDREPFALFDPAADGRLWVFWERKKANGLWNVFSRTTTNLNFASLTNADWVETENLPAPASFDNREPAATLAPTGEVELYFASNRTDGWNTWTRFVTPSTQGPEANITNGQATQRAPAPLRIPPTRVRLFFRTNDTFIYTSSVYPAAQTFDARYSGSTTVDMRNPTKLSLRGTMRDLGRYTYDVRRPDPGDPEPVQGLPEGLYARDSVGVYLTPDTDDQALILRQRRLFANALRRFIPIQVRLSFLIDEIFQERIYTYDQPRITPEVLIDERMLDTILA
jgi:phage tail-like protein